MRSHPFELRRSGRKNTGRRGDAGVRDGAAEPLDRRNGILGYVLWRHAFVDDLVHERTVGAILEQAPDEVGEQVVMGAHRRVDPAPDAMRLAHSFVQGFAHPLQALELEARGIVGHVQHRGYRVCVVGRELRIDAVRHPEKLAGAGEVGHVGARLAGEDRENRRGRESARV